MMLLCSLHPIWSCLDNNIALHMVMMHLLQYKEWQKNPQNQFIPVARGYLNHKCNHDAHFGGILVCLMDLHSYRQLRMECIPYLKHHCTIRIRWSKQKILRNDPFRRLSPCSIMCSYLCSIQCYRIDSHRTILQLIISYVWRKMRPQCGGPFIQCLGRS